MEKITVAIAGLIEYQWLIGIGEDFYSIYPPAHYMM
jgi:hypothetical protein